MPDTNVTAMFPKEQAEAIASSLAPLTMIGAGGPMLGALLDIQLTAHGWPPLDLPTRKFVGGPIIVHNGTAGWGPRDNEHHPIKEYRSQIFAERIEIALGLTPWIVGPSEITMVMYAATLDGPLRSPAADIYVWAGSHAAVKRHFPDKTYLDLQLKTWDGDTGVTDEMILSDRGIGQSYRDLCREIRRKVEAASAVESTRKNAEHKPVVHVTMDMFANA